VPLSVLPYLCVGAPPAPLCPVNGPLTGLRLLPRLYLPVLAPLPSALLLCKRPLPPLAVGHPLGVPAMLSVCRLPNVLHMSSMSASFAIGVLLLASALRTFPAPTLRVMSTLRLLHSPPLTCHGPPLSASTAARPPARGPGRGGLRGAGGVRIVGASVGSGATASGVRGARRS
jgi:hypothetical protein